MQKVAICVMGGVSFFFCFSYVERYIGAYQGYIALAVGITMAIGAGIVLLTVFKRGKEALFSFLYKITAGKTAWEERIRKLSEQADILQDGAGRLYKKKGLLFAALSCGLLLWGQSQGYYDLYLKYLALAMGFLVLYGIFFLVLAFGWNRKSAVRGQGAERH